MCQYSDIYLNKSNLLNDSFLCTELKKILVSEFFFKFNNYFFSTGTPTTNKLHDSVAQHWWHNTILVANTISNTGKLVKTIHPDSFRVEPSLL